MSQMLSLPEDWDYTLAGLSKINRESIDAIRTAVWELEKAGYITRRQRRDEKGKMTTIEYTIVISSYSNTKSSYNSIKSVTEIITVTLNLFEHYILFLQFEILIPNSSR